MVVRNSVFNLLGLGLPLVVALAAIPQLILALGTEQFGILTIIWAVVSYFGLFDLGLGRAVTQQVALALASKDDDRLGRIVGTSSGLMLGLGVLGGVMMLLAAPVLTRELTVAADPRTVVRSFFWMALAMPAIVLTAGYRGILEAAGRFGLVNAIRLPMGIYTYAGPLMVVWSGRNSLVDIAAILCVGRIVSCAVHGYYARRVLPRGIAFYAIDRHLVRPLFSLGGWISVSNVVSPLMSYIDRFLLGIAVSAQAITFYATPQELVLRIGIIPTAIAGVLFPVFAAQSIGRSEDRARRHLWQYSLVIFVLLLPLCAVLAVFAHAILATWISPAFADQASDPLRIMAIAALFSGMAQVPFTMLQGRSRADWTARLHLIELPLYVGLLYLLVKSYGVTGAAVAWLARIALDMAVLYYLCLRNIGSRQVQPIPSSGSHSP